MARYVSVGLDRFGLLRQRKVGQGSVGNGAAGSDCQGTVRPGKAWTRGERPGRFGGDRRCKAVLGAVGKKIRKEQ